MVKSKNEHISDLKKRFLIFNLSGRRNKTKGNVLTYCGEKHISLDIMETDIYSNGSPSGASKLNCNLLWLPKFLLINFMPLCKMSV